MKVIRLNNETKQKLLEEYKATLLKEMMDKLEKYNEVVNSVAPMKESAPAQNKLKIYYTAEAYSKIVQLVFSHSLEIGWNMVVKKYKDGYRVEDVLVYPQKASGAYIEVDLPRYGLWKGDPDKVSDEADRNLFGQGHSHVNMDVFASTRDQQQQKDEIQLKGSGFYLFQIWNKRMDVNSFFYDIDKNILYERNDIELIVEDGNVESTEFIAESKEMLKEKPKEEPKELQVTNKEQKKENRSRRRRPRSFEDILADKIEGSSVDNDEDFYYNGYYNYYRY